MTANIFPSYKTASVDSLIPYARNSRTHSDAQITKIAASIKEFGFLNPVIVDGDNGIVAGHGRVMAAKKLGMDEVPTIEASHLTDAQKRAYVIADNRLALDAGWDDEMLKVEFAELEELGFDLDLTGFDIQEIKGLMGDDADHESGENPYSDKIDAPTYEPKGDKPAIGEIYSRAKTELLMAKIADADLPDDVRLFLVSAAHRHTEFNYEAIAEFYCHADPEVQSLMEDSALVIIDFDKAIESGYVALSKELAEIHSEEKNGY
jgi:ParB-like chromosome segregation protein Spo0J